MTGIEYLRRRDLHPLWDGYSDPNREDVADAYEQGKTDGYHEGARCADSHPHWISVKDELPPIGGIVLVAIPLGGELSVLPLSIKNESDFECLSGMTHWMPLPEPPKKGGEE